MKHALTARLDGGVVATMHFGTPHPGRETDDNVIFTGAASGFIATYRNGELIFSEYLPEIFTAERIEEFKKTCMEFIEELKETGLM
ncbi:MAG: hypothetical protein LUD47_07875 [Clostridia bacterium]|nr:hypothetical protein [Clostridia bacterium]